MNFSESNLKFILENLLNASAKSSNASAPFCTLLALSPNSIAWSIGFFEPVKNDTTPDAKLASAPNPLPLANVARPPPRAVKAPAAASVLSLSAFSPIESNVSTSDLTSSAKFWPSV